MAKGVISFMAAFVFLIVGFAVAFMILYLPSSAAKVTAHGDFSLVHTTLLRLNVMMLGEFYYKDLVDNQIFPGTIHIITFLFLFMISVILMNLLVGMAVSDIQGLSKTAEIIQMEHQLELIVYMQDLILSPVLFAPQKIKEWLKSKIIKLRDQESKLVFEVKPFKHSDNQFSEEIKRSLYEHCVTKVAQEKEFNRDAELRELRKMMQDLHNASLGGEKGTCSVQMDHHDTHEAHLSPHYRDRSYSQLSSVSSVSIDSRPTLSRRATLLSMRSLNSRGSLQFPDQHHPLHMQRISEEDC